MKGRRKEPLKFTCVVCGIEAESYSLRPQLTCSTRCRSARRYALNPKKQKVFCDNWKNNNKKKVHQTRREWLNIPNNKRKVKNTNRKTYRKGIDKLSDWYIRHRLIRQGLPITKETIEEKRMILKIKRAIHETTRKIKSSGSNGCSIGVL